jgi:KUP system potassium uptake protein
VSDTTPDASGPQAGDADRRSGPQVQGAGVTLGPDVDAPTGADADTTTPLGEADAASPQDDGQVAADADASVTPAADDGPRVRAGAAAHGGGSHHGRQALGVLALGALGVVFGDIGTSPLYALRETFHFNHLDPTRDNVLGVLSIVFWSLILVITVKYLWVVMRADNRGEGGIMALTSLITRSTPRQRRWVLILCGIFGAALLYGDGAITPAISVLAAVEGIEVAAPSLEAFVVPLAVIILIALFAVQRRGTASIGKVFGPIMLVWFGTLAVLGITNLGADASVFEAINPAHAVRFFGENGMTGFLALGSMFLVVTGGEALYADMGHFGRRPIAWAWYVVVLPCLMIFYFGQGASLLAHPDRVEQPFYSMAPDWAVLPLTVVATAATVIASQALITGVFSLTMQATQLGWLPRVRILHTSAAERGQIYLPAFNWGLLAACIALVVGFGSSSALAAAYGLAVTGTMLVTTTLFYVVARERFGWSQRKALVVCGLFAVIDAAFLGANVFKIPDGGWFPLVVAIAIFAAMTTWHRGRAILRERLQVGQIPLDTFLTASADLPRVPGTAVYLYSQPGITPPALIKNARHNLVIHEQLIILSVITEEVPHVPAAERSVVRPVPVHAAYGHDARPSPPPPGRVRQVELHYGFMEAPDVDDGLTEGDAAHLGVGEGQTTYFVGSENLVATDRPGMAMWRERLFAAMSRNATPAARWFNLPNDDVMAVGATVEL